MKTSLKWSVITVMCLLLTGICGSVAFAEYYGDSVSNGYYDSQQQQWNQQNLLSNKAWLGFGIGGSTMNVNGPAQNSGIPTSGVVGTIDFGYKWTYAAVRGQFTGGSVSSTWYNVNDPWQQYSYTVGAYTYDIQVMGVFPIEKIADVYAGIGIGGLSLDYSGYVASGWNAAYVYSSSTYFNVPISVGADVALGQHFALNFDATYNLINGGNNAPQSYTTYTGGVKFMM